MRVNLALWLSRGMGSALTMGPKQYNELSRGFMRLLIVVIAGLFVAQSGWTQSLDYAYFRDRVQPIFLKKRPGHARCIVCHEHGSPPLQLLTPGAVTWDDDQSRKNYQIWKQFVVPGQPEKSPLLLHPLAQSAGGDTFHAGGKHWHSKDDPEWRILAAWVNGQSDGGSK
jgi:hypothetical protein